MQKAQETQVQSLGWEDLLEKEMTTHSSILAWEIPQTEEPGRLQSIGLQSQTQQSTHTEDHTSALSKTLNFFQLSYRNTIHLVTLVIF